MIRSTNLLFDIRPRIRPPASPTKLARATISRTVVVLKKTKLTKGERLANQSRINSKSEKKKIRKKVAKK